MSSKVVKKHTESSESEERARYPTSKEIQEQATAELDAILNELTNLPKDLHKRMKIFLLHLKNEDIPEFLGIEDATVKKSVAEVLAKSNVAEFKKYPDRWKSKLFQKTDSAVNKLLSKEEVFMAQGEDNRKKLCAELVNVNNNNYSALYALDRPVATMLNSPDKERLFKSLIDLPMLQHYYEKPSLESSVREIVEDLFEAFLDRSSRSRETIDKIIEQKDFNLLAIRENKSLLISPLDKDNLIRSIQSLEIYKNYCYTEGRDLDQLKNSFHRELMGVLRDIPPVIHERENITKGLLSNPSENFYHPGLSLSASEKLREELRKMQSRADYERLKNELQSLQSSKTSTINKILAKASVYEEGAREELSKLLVDFRIAEFFKHQAIRKNWQQVYDYMTKSEECRGYFEAKRTGDMDIREKKRNLSERLYRELASSTAIALPDLSLVVARAVQSCNTIEIEKYIMDFLRNQQRLIDTFQGLREFQDCVEHQGTTSLEEQTRRQLLGQVSKYADSHESACEIVDNIILFGSETEIDITIRLSPNNKESLKDEVTDRKNCPNFYRYVRLYGYDLVKCEELMRRALAPKRREFGIKPIELFADLVNSVCRDKNLQCIPKERELTQLQKQLLLAFFSANRSCKDFFESCDVERLVVSVERLKEEISSNFAKMGKNDLNQYFEEPLTEIILDFCEIDTSLRGICWDSIDVSELLADKETQQFLNKIKGSEAYRDYRLCYPLFLDKEFCKAKKIFKRYFETELSNVKIAINDVFEKLLAMKFDLRKLEEIVPGQKPKVYDRLRKQCDNSRFYNKFMNLLKAQEVRELLVAQIKLENRIDSFVQDVSLAELRQEDKLELLRNVKLKNLTPIFQSLQISEMRKKDLIVKLVETEEFKNYVAILQKLGRRNEIDNFQSSIETYFKVKPEIVDVNPELSTRKSSNVTFSLEPDIIVDKKEDPISSIIS